LARPSRTVCRCMKKEAHSLRSSFTADVALVPLLTQAVRAGPSLRSQARHFWTPLGCRTFGRWKGARLGVRRQSWKFASGSAFEGLYVNLPMDAAVASDPWRPVRKHLATSQNLFRAKLLLRLGTPVLNERSLRGRFVEHRVDHDPSAATSYWRGCWMSTPPPQARVGKSIIGANATHRSG
jgi:hypothetical protein